MGIARDLVQSIQQMIDSAINKAPFDRTRKARVVGASEDGGYDILLDGNTYSNIKTLNKTQLAPDNIVKVLIPENQATNMVIIDSVVQSWNNIIDKPTEFNPPIASNSVLGGIKVGSGLTIDANGVLSASGGGAINWDDINNKPSTFPPPIASSSTLGGVKVGSGLSIDANGVLSASGTSTITWDNVTNKPSTFPPPTASSSVLGGVKVGTGLSINTSGVLSVSADIGVKWNNISDKPTTFPPSTHSHSVNDITGKLPLSKGGTGSDTGLANAPKYAIIRKDGSGDYLYYTATANGAFYATAANGAPKFGTLPIAQGGTGATSASGARNGLGVSEKSGCITIGSYKIQWGSVNVTLSGTTEKSATVTFTEKFGSTPNAVAGYNGGTPVDLIHTGSITTSGMTVYCRGTSSTASGTRAINWIAIG